MWLPLLYQRHIVGVPNLIIKSDIEIIIVTKSPLLKLHYAMFFPFSSILEKYSCLFKGNIFLFGRILTSYSTCTIWP